MIIWMALSLQSLAQQPLAEGKEKWLGSVHSPTQIKDFEQYWNQVTPENAGKWGSVERTRDSYNWGPLDDAYNFAKENGFPFRFHVLLWGNQQPTWIETLEPSEQLEEIAEWMDTVAARYPDIDYLEVVNEPFNDPPNGAGNGNYFNALGGRGSSGYDWLIEGFRMARERFPNTKLMMNEYNVLNNLFQASTYVKVVNLLKQEGLIDVIGVQGHAFTTTTGNETMENVLESLAQTELPIMVTELDIDGPSDDVQLQSYKRIFPLLWEHPSVIGITLWGFRPGLWRNEQKAYLIDTDGSERPALTWLRSYVEQSNASLTLSEENDIRFGIYPNPADRFVYVNSSSEVVEVVIRDLVGRVLHVSSDAEVALPASLTTGTYMVSVKTVSGEIFSRRLKVN